MNRFDIRPFLSPWGGALAGPANVVMQMGLPAVGYGVAESRVPSGSVMEHPLKRARTTFTYLAVALLGTDEDRRAYRAAVNRQHALVRSTAASPVAYDAMDPSLQLWVAACLYFGAADVTRRLYGPINESDADGLYGACSALATTLQVPVERWPADRAAFERYWRDGIAHVRYDPKVRGYLMRLLHLENLPWPVPPALRGQTLFWTSGFLPPEFRERLGLRWDGASERRFSTGLRRLGALEAAMPLAARAAPFEMLLADMRRRRRRGLPLV